MGNILSAINDDVKEYEALCRKYGQEVKTSPDAYGNQIADCYGDHAASLQARHNKELNSLTEAAVLARQD